MNFNSSLIKFILTDIVILSKQKYSSNVIEKVKNLLYSVLNIVIMRVRVY